MRIFAYNEQDANNPLLITDKQILEEYYPYWSSELKRLGRIHLISKENCIEDWVVINWAWELK